MDDAKQTEYIYGRNPVLEAMNQPDTIAKVFLAFGSEGAVINKIYSLCGKNKIPVTKYDKNKFRELEKKLGIANIASQGVIALCSVGNFIELDQISENPRPYDIIVALDGIEDPHNLGAIARSAECSGALAMILSIRNSAPITPAAVKASAGTLSNIPIVKVSSLYTTLLELKDEGWSIVCAEANGTNLYTDSIYDRPMVLVIGSEGKGVSPTIRKISDYSINIPLHGKANSLNASVSAGIVLFEIKRQEKLMYG